MKKCNKYDSVIESLRYYASDRRRNKEFREIVTMAYTALSAANIELKECQEMIETYTNSAYDLMAAAEKLKRYTEERK